MSPFNCKKYQNSNPDEPCDCVDCKEAEHTLAEAKELLK